MQDFEDFCIDKQEEIEGEIEENGFDWLRENHPKEYAIWQEVIYKLIQDEWTGYCDHMADMVKDRMEEEISNDTE